MKFNMNIVPNKIDHLKEIADVKDVFLKTEIEILLNNWCVQQINQEYIFFKHFNSNRKGVIYQLILSGNEYDGIYELEVFGHDLKFKNVFKKEINDLMIEVKTNGNYDLARFNKKSYTFTVDRNITGDESFKIEIRKYLQQLSKIDIVEVIGLDNSIIQFDQQELGEIKFRGKLHNLLKKSINDIQKINFCKKKKQYYISKLDLGEEAFKKELFKRNMITPEEYEIYTTGDRNENAKLFSELRKIEII
ncbi:hypothetical protein [Alkaliphilus sp. B6464]|uniref:hypothetical protein n=1 Tax=Alkaliphilus sp. B6464 TaxID=2731219 RepID=UPI001BAA3580|nr:hypothetical protein [Alkaliphilus sp. B6464]QUH22035.1 hypothetical protein HYG84_19205 [Alkaliphilus sp. B6464]